MSETASPSAKGDSPAAVNGVAEEKTPARPSRNGLAPGQKLTRGYCAPCRANKLKCNKRKPSCDKCYEAGIECGWAIEQKRRTVPANEEPEIFVFPEAQLPSKTQATKGSKVRVQKEKAGKEELSAKPKPRKSTEQEQLGNDADQEMVSPKEEDSNTTVRRSSRVRKPNSVRQLGDSVEEDDEFDDAEGSQSPTLQKSRDKAGDEVRRNPKRKAAPVDYELPDELLGTTMQPSEPAELDEWEGWIEVESDPAFFNVILQSLGVKDVKLQEVYSVDEGSLSLLPKPVHGLIFLYQYVEEDAQEETENGHNVWFANQTTDNACATLALFNIIMNAKHIKLGERLQAFKEQSSDLTPALKGHELCNTTWIRSIHNQFARRLDLLNAELCLSNAEEEQRKRKPAPSRFHAAKKQRKTKKPLSGAAYHFVAYVPVDGEVYQLDGLEKAPVSIGKIDPQDAEEWTAVARPYIEARMLQYEDQQLQFNLLAVCGSPLSQLRHELATNIHSYNYLAAKLRLRHKQHADASCNGADIAIPKPDGFLTFDDRTIEIYGLYYSDMNMEFGDPNPADLLSWHGAGIGSRSVGDVRDCLEQLFSEQAHLRATYKTEAMIVEEETERAINRKNDYTQHIHEYIEMLAENGAVAELVKEV